MRGFKTEGVDGNLLFCWRERVPNQTWLAPVICKSGRKLTSKFPRYVTGGSEESISSSLVRCNRRSEVECVGRVCGNVSRDIPLCLAITVVVVDRYSWPVHRSLFKVWTSISVKLGIQVRIETTLKDWIIRKVDAANNVSRLKLSNLLAQTKTLTVDSTYANLLCLRKVILGICIQCHHPKWSNWDDLLWYEFSIVQNIEAKSELLIFIEDLNTELMQLISKFYHTSITLLQKHTSHWG